MVFSPVEFVAVLNQALENIFPFVVIEGELANFRVSKNRWVYFDLKDESASVKFFGTVYNLPGPLEEGMKLRVTGRPQLHPLYGFSVTVQSIALSGEGTLKKAFELLKANLEKEGLFDPARKRTLPYPPQTIGLVTSGESAAYADFIKVISARWQGVTIRLADVQVQGEAAPRQISAAIEWFNAQAELMDVLVVIRGGGSADDLQAFSTEQVTRAVAASRIPTLVAIGHEIDTSLAELAADVRASTPSNAAELLVPDRKDVLESFAATRTALSQAVKQLFRQQRQVAQHQSEVLGAGMQAYLRVIGRDLAAKKQIMQLLDPELPLQRGYALLTKGDKLVRSIKQLHAGDSVAARLHDGDVTMEVQS